MINKKMILIMGMIFLIGIVVAEGITLLSSPGDLELDSSLKEWVKETHGIVKTSDVTWDNSTNMWRYTLINSSNKDFWIIKFSGNTDDSQEEINKKVDLWTSKWLEKMYENQTIQEGEITKPGRDYTTWLK